MEHGPRLAEFQILYGSSLTGPSQQEVTSQRWLRCFKKTFRKDQAGFKLRISIPSTKALN